MLFTAIGIIAFTAVVAYVLRAAYLVITPTMIEQRRELPLSFAWRPLSLPATDTFVTGLQASLWRIADPSLPPGGGPAPTNAPVTRTGFKLGRHEFWPGPRGIEWRIDGRTRVDRGTLAISDQRLAFRGRRERLDIPLSDITGFDVRGPLLELRRRSAPAEPVAFRVPQPVLVARVVQALVVRGASAARPR
jgi:hypothetical protein